MLGKRQRVVVIHREIERRTDRQVGSRGAQHRAECDLRRDLDVGTYQRGDLQPELAELRLTDLQERPGLRRADVVALRVHEEDLRVCALDLAAEDERRRAVGARRRQGLTVARHDLAADSAEIERRFEEVVDRRQGLAPVGCGQVAVDPIEDFLGGREVPGGLDHECPVGRALDHVHLAVGADVVDAGARAGVGQEDDPVVELDREAVGHWRRPAACAASSAALSWPSTIFRPLRQKSGSARSQSTMRARFSGVSDPPARSRSR